MAALRTAAQRAVLAISLTIQAGLLGLWLAARDREAFTASLRVWRSGEDWPDVSDEALEAALDDWLTPYLAGITRREHLARLDLASIFNGLGTDTTLVLRRDLPRAAAELIGMFVVPHGC